MQRCDTIRQGEVCHQMIESSPLQGSQDDYHGLFSSVESSSLHPFNTSRNFSFILNTEKYDHFLEDKTVEISLKFPFIGDVTVKSGTTTHVQLTFEKQNESDKVILTKTTKIEQGLQDDYLGLFSSMRVGKYLQKSCYALPSRALVLEHAYPGLCNLLQDTIHFQSDGHIIILDASKMLQFKKIIDKFVSDNLAFVTINVQV